MKGMKRALAFVMAFSLSVTSAWMQQGVTAKAGQGAEAGNGQAAEPAAVMWDADYAAQYNEGYGTNYEVDETGALVQTTEFLGASAYVSSLSLPTDSDFYYVDSDALNALMGMEDGGVIDKDELSFTYQWSKAADDGAYEELEGETDSYLYVGESITNENRMTKYRCTAVLSEVGYEPVPEGTDIALQYEMAYAYTGVTWDQIESGSADFSDYFYVEGFTEEDETVDLSSLTMEREPEYFDISYEEYGSRMDYSLTALYSDGSSEEVETAEDVSYFDSSDVGLSYLKNGKAVSSYQLHIDFKYGAQVIRSMDKTYRINYTGVDPDKVKLEDCFTFSDFTPDKETIKFMDKDATASPSYFYVRVNEDWEDACMDYTLSCVYADGTEREEPVRNVTSASYLGSYQLYLAYMLDEKEVASYQLHVDFKYGAKILGTVEKEFELSYIGGVTKEDIEKNPELLNDYFNGVETLSDQKLTYPSLEGSQWVSPNVSGKYTGHTSIKYTWKAYAADGGEGAVLTEEETNYLPGRDLPLFSDFGERDENGEIVESDVKQVAYYELAVAFFCNEAEIAAKNVRYDVSFTPIYASSYDFMARKGETKELTARPNSYYEGDIGKITYEWRTVGKDGKETRLDGENGRSVYVKINDFDTSYKCVFSAEKLKEAFPNAVIGEMSCVLTPKESTGYRLKKIIGESQSVRLSDPVELGVKVAVDEGYTLSYLWEKAKEQENESGEKEIVFTPIQGAASASYRIDKTTEEDFVAAYDEAMEERYTHRLTVQVRKGAEEMGASQYYFCLGRLEEDPYVIDTNLYALEEGETYQDAVTHDIERGESLTLYVRSQVNDPAYAITKKWYRVHEIAYVAKKDADGGYVHDADGNLEYVPEEPGAVPPAESGREPLETVDHNSWDFAAGGYTKKTVAYFEALQAKEDDSAYELTGKNSAGTLYDVRGTYLVDVTVGGSNATAADPVESVTYAVCLAYDSGLSAYAKSSNVTAAEGGSATLEVIAGNKNESLYEIAYQWEKWNDDAGQYEAVQNANGKKYTIGKLAKKDYGNYRVKASDLSGREIFVFFTLSEDLTEPYFYTPATSYFNKSLGDDVTMEVKADIPESMEVSYDWYCTDQSIDYTAIGDWEEVADENWQIIGEEAAKYSFRLSEEEEFRAYKCVARYQSNGTRRERVFYFYVEDVTKNLLLERTTPGVLYKKVGDSASYGVRYKTDSAEILPEDVSYQWHKEDGTPIEGATQAAYTIDSISAEDFGVVYCEVTYSKRNRPKRISFQTLFYSDVEILSGEAVACAVGEDVKLTAKVNNPSGQKLSYQWHFENYGIIYGATDPSYTIGEIGKNQFGLYYCEISDGDCYIGSYTVRVLWQNPEEKDIILEDYVSEVSVPAGKAAAFQVSAKSDGGLALSYQWHQYTEDKGAVAIGGADEPTYTIPKALPAHAGSYFCEIRDTEGNMARAAFTLTVKSGLSVDSGSREEDDLIGYQTSLGKTVAMKANAAVEGDYEIFYQWHKVDDLYEELGAGNVIYGATKNELTISGVTMDDLGYYVCVVTDANGSEKRLNYQVYINTGLVIEPSTARPIASADGSVTMYVKAEANEGIQYQWSKWDVTDLAYVDISGATKASYRIPSITKGTMGSYRCTVFTSGERYSYFYTVDTLYGVSQSRAFAEQNQGFTLSSDMRNRVTDAKYTYVWYEADAVTGSQKKTGCTTASYAGKAPVIKMSGSVLGYVPVSYSCEVYRDGVLMQEQDFTLNVLPKVTYSTSALPQTAHPFDKRVDMQAYRLAGAQSIVVTLDPKSGETLVIDAGGQGYPLGGEYGNVMTLSGNSAIFLAYDGNGIDYGYKVSSIVDAASKPGVKPPTGGGSVSQLPAQNKVYPSGQISYKVTKSAASGGTVSAVGVHESGKVKKGTITSLVIPKTVSIMGYTFQVTAIEAKAFSGCKKLGRVTIEANVASIGSQAFKGCPKLGNIIIKTTKLTAKSVGAKAFSGVKKTAKVKVPKKKLAAYKKFLKKKGFGKKAKITK